MKRPVQVVLLALSGLGLLQVSLFTDMFLRYVKPGMRPLLIVSGVVLLTLGLAEAWSAYRTARRDEGHPPPHVAWLLFLPALSLLCYAPPALGSYTAAREAPRVAEPRDAGDEDFEPLPAASPVPITLGDFTRRVRQDRTMAIKERTVRMTGFVTPADEGDGWYLTRLVLNCCAADAQSVKVRVHGAVAPKADAWVTVTGTWHPGGTLGTNSAEVALDVSEVKKVQRPSNSYMDALPLG